MATDGERLARVQVAAHAAIDAIYQPLSVAVGAAVERGFSGRTIQTNDDRIAVTRNVDALLADREGDLRLALADALTEAQRAAEVGREPVRPDLAFMRDKAEALVQITASILLARQIVFKQTDKLLVRGITLGLTPLQVASTVRQYFMPFYATRRDAAGNIVRDRMGAVQSWPGKAGMASAHVRMAMLTETNAMHYRTIVRVAERDNRLLRYHVSHKHLQIDECDRLERADVGFGGGVYPPNEAPRVPRHPRCRCWYEPADREPFLTRSESVPA